MELTTHNNTIPQVRFTAFGEKFDVSLSPLRRSVGDGSRVRALNAKGDVLADRASRLCTYEGHLPMGGWVRAIVRSPTSATVHFFHNVRPFAGSALCVRDVDGKYVRMSRMPNTM